MPTIATVTEADLDDLLPLLRGYLSFYGATPSDQAVLALSHALIADPGREGVQLLARDDSGTAIGFATVFWWWSTLSAARIAQMNDLFVAEPARGTGAAEALIKACVQTCRDRGDIHHLAWQTAKDNHRAQAVYDQIGGERSEWVDYSLPTRP